MLCKELPLQVPGSQPKAKATLYLLNDMPRIHRRPLVIVCPGGAYQFCSIREGEPIALEFLAQGYHAAVMEYSTAPSRFPVALTEVALLVKTLREQADEWRIDPEHLFICGFSAGGHLAASYGVFWHEAWLAASLQCACETLRPQGMILSYPVITGGEGCHEGSFHNLLGENCEAMRHELSLERRVTPNAPPAFIWHTGEDESVPVVNSLKMAAALTNARVPVEFHLFPRGQHGMALCDERTLREDGWGSQPEAAQWMPLCLKWLRTQR
ncbi:MAG: alpha/beta hydrolase [Clostridia bacterium]|nr:alpha/beta hydrolase [Clostridia bacterium]